MSQNKSENFTDYLNLPLPQINAIMVPSHDTSSLKPSNMAQTHCSVNSSSQLVPSDPHKKIKSFKRIKQGYLDQKNNEGRVIKKRIHNDSDSPIKNRVKRLQDAITIYSQESPKSDRSPTFRIDESIIIMSSRDIQIQNKKCQVKLQLPQNAELYKRRYINLETLQKQNQKKSKNNIQVLKKLKSNPSLVCLPEIGFIVHEEKQQFQLKCYNKIINAYHKGLLSLYHVGKLKQTNIENNQNKTSSKNKNLCQVFYQPYQQQFTEFLLKVQSIQYKEFLGFIHQIIQTLIYLIKIGIFPQIEPSVFVMTNQNLKLILRPNKIQQTQKQILKNLGLYLHLIVKQLSQSSLQGPTPKNSKIKGFNIFMRIQMKQLIEKLIKNQHTKIEDIKTQVERLIKQN